MRATWLRRASGLVIGAIFGVSSAQAAEPQLDCARNPEFLHPIFTDHMVLQRDVLVPVWGCTTPGHAVTVSVAGRSARTTADASGFWTLRLPSMAAGGPYAMVVTGATRRVLNDVLIGDVWLCSGQSNMQWPIRGVLRAKQEIADSVKYRRIRLFTVPIVKGLPEPQQVFKGSPTWQVNNPSTVPTFSATCYFFGRDLFKRTSVPQGLIASSVGGTAIEWWMSARSLAHDPDFAGDIARIDSGQSPAGNLYPTTLFNGMIAPLVPFALRGIAWYQGERNAQRAAQYRRLLPNMIADWRRWFGLGEGPFLIVQLPRFRAPQTRPSENSSWPKLREVQMQTSLDVPGVGLAVTIDTGQADTIHPTDKQDVGDRLSVLARGMAYHEPIAAEGPIYTSMSVEGSSIRLRFANAANGLMAGSKQPLRPVVELSDAKLTGFAIAGANRRFVWANARIEGSSVVVSAPQVRAPVAVRYGWALNPSCNLYEKSGLPASPFRTDAW